MRRRKRVLLLSWILRRDHGAGFEGRTYARWTRDKGPLNHLAIR